jgi:hypothetical protein
MKRRTHSGDNITPNIITISNAIRDNTKPTNPNMISVSAIEIINSKVIINRTEIINKIPYLNIF